MVARSTWSNLWNRIFNLWRGIICIFPRCWKKHQMKWYFHFFWSLRSWLYQEFRSKHVNEEYDHVMTNVVTPNSFRRDDKDVLLKITISYFIKQKWRNIVCWQWKKTLKSIRFDPIVMGRKREVTVKILQFLIIIPYCRILNLQFYSICTYFDLRKLRVDDSKIYKRDTSRWANKIWIVGIPNCDFINNNGQVMCV